MKKMMGLFVAVLVGLPAFAATNLQKNEHGESMVCTYGDLSVAAVQDVDMLVASGQNSTGSTSLSVYLNAYPGSEDSINATVTDGPVQISSPLKISSINNDCTASVVLNITIGGVAKELACTIYNSRLATKETWTNCSK